ncbi:YD repeat-containing protein [Andreprevotia lacus DSM 23236]|jgi:YD repeat-containing protein|uniref:YD repeat-containing protein n=1 Tax=Andreprevotia lacus DSM 23236 TaxID=1121001 RepID=A0A1W1X3F4_9NEIS|nr:LysM peptidoglycan-binding domain-containing protein [Andreprevotia lacus]SMC18258.1 YD repeat-containing protein [Andreprevotia lacus DSM 23236]
MVAIVGGNGLGLSGSSREVLGSQGVVGNAKTGNGNEAVYVNAGTGNLVLQQHDTLLLGGGLQPDLLRTYNSNGTWDGDNNDQWRIGFYKRIYGLTGTLNTAGSTIKRVDGDEFEATYTYDTTRGEYVSTAGAGAFDSLRYDSASQSWAWKDGASGGSELYKTDGSGSAWRLATQSNAAGDQVRVQYNAAGQINRIESWAAGDATYNSGLQLQYSGTKLTEVGYFAKDSNNVETSTTRVRYGYDTSNRLITVTVDLSPEDSSTADGKAYVTNYTYDGTSKRLASISQTDGSRLEFTYDASFRIATVRDVRSAGDIRITTYSYAGSQTTITDPANQATVFTFDAAGQVTGIKYPTDSYGTNAPSFTYDAAGNVTTIWDGRNYNTRYAYDARGNLVYELRPNYSAVRRTYDANDHLIEQIEYTNANDYDGIGGNDATGALKTRFVYDTLGNLRFKITPEGRTTEYRYDARGLQIQQLQYTDALYTATTASYGDLTTWSAARDLTKTQRTDTAYDVLGQIQSVTTFEGMDGAGQGVSPLKTAYIYDAFGRLLQRIDQRGLTTAGIANDYSTVYTYDGLGRVLTASQYDANGVAAVTTTLYDDANRQVQMTQANGLQITSVYDAGGNLLSHNERASNVDLGTIRYVYDKMGRRVQMVDVLGRTSIYFYDNNGRQIAEIAPDGAMTETVYNNNGQVLQRVVYSNRLASSTYNTLVGNPAAYSLSQFRQVSSTDTQTRYFYNAAGWMMFEVDDIRSSGTSNIIEYVYNGTGAKTAVIRYAKQINTYDLDRQIVAGSEPGDNYVRTLAGTYTADAANNRQQRYFYSDDGLLLGELDASGALTEYKYNVAGQRIGVVRYATLTAIAQQQSGTLAQLRPVSTAGDLLTNYIYNGRGQLVGTIDPAGALTEYRYDQAGNRSNEIHYVNAARDRNAATLIAALPAASTDDQSTALTYDHLNRVVREERQPQNTVTTYTYDAAGNLTQKVTALGTAEQRTQQWRYDAQGHLTVELNGEAVANGNEIGAVRYTYDLAGRKISATDGNGRRTVFYYDANDRLVLTINADGEVEETAYNTLNLITKSTRYANKLATGIVAGLNGGAITSFPSTQLDAIKDATKDKFTSWGFGANGLLVQIKDAGGVLQILSYNAFGEIIRKDITAADGATYLSESRQYDTLGHLRFITDPSSAKTEYRYDVFGRLIVQVDPLGRTTTTAYDADGRVIQVTDPTGASRYTSYDMLGRVYTTTDANGKVTRYTYNGATRETTVTTPEGVTITTQRNAQSEVVKVTNGEGHVTTYRYDRNGQRIAEVAGANEVDLTSTTRYDKAGNVIETNTQGVITRFSYDASGRVLTRQVDPDTLNLTSEYRFDGTGQKIWEKRPDGVWVKTEFDNRGRVTASTIDPATNPDGSTKAGALALRTEYVYDYVGNVTQLTEGAGGATQKVTKYTYDFNTNRRLTEVVDANNLKLTTRYDYDSAGQVTARYDAANNATRFTYDSNGRVHYTIDALGDVSEVRYDAQGNRIADIRYSKPITLPATVNDANVLATLQGLYPGPNGSVVDLAAQSTRYVYDQDNRLTHTVDALGNVVEQRYDRDNNVVQRIAYASPLASSAVWQTRADLVALLNPTNAANQVSYSVYDALDRQIYAIDALGYVTQNRFNSYGQLAAVTQYAKAITVPAIRNADNVANAIKADAANDRTNCVLYDGAGRRIASVDADGYLTEYQLDNVGQQISVVRYAAKALASGFSPSGGLPININLLRPNVAGTADHINRATYDAVGRKLTAVDAEGIQTRYLYDARGLVTDQIQADGTADAVTTHYDYDTAGRLIRETSAYGTADVGVTEYTLDALGNRVAILDPRNYAIYTSDAAWAQAERTARGYPASANQVAGNTTIRAALSVTQTFDKLGRLTGSTNQQSNQTQINYDAFGNVIRSVDLVGNTTYKVYDTNGRVIQNIDPAGFLTGYRYDAFGNLIGKTTYFNGVLGTIFPGQLVQVIGMEQIPPQTGAFIRSDGKDYIYTDSYDARNQRAASISTVVQADQSTTQFQETYSYNAFGQQATATNRNGGTVVYKYDRLGNRTEETLPVTNASGQVVKNQYLYDAFGNRTQTTEAVGLAEQRVTQFGFDKLGRQISKLGQSFTVYDPLTGGSYNAQTLERTFYDKRGNIVETQVGLQDPNAVGQVSNPNRTLNFYDKANRVTTQVSPDGVVTVRHYDSSTLVLDTTTYATKLASMPAFGSTTPPVVTVSSSTDRSLFYTYDLLGHMSTERTTTVVYSSLATNSSGQVSYQLNTGALQTTKYFDAAGNLLQEVDRRGNSIYHYYDGLGRQIQQVDAEGYVTTWQYLPNRTVEIHYANKLTVAPQRGIRQTPAASADDRITTSDLDALGRAIRKTISNVAFTNLQLITDLKGQAIPAGAITYAGQGYLLPTSGTGAATTSLLYDGLGNVTRQIDADGYATDMAYDTLGRLTEKRVYRSKLATGDATAQRTSYAYDGLGNVVTETQLSITGAYDRIKKQSWVNGKLIQTMDAENNVVSYKYDRYGNLAYVGTEFAATAASSQQAFTDATIVNYDQMGREISRMSKRMTPQANGSISAQYDDVTDTLYNTFGEIVQRRTRKARNDNDIVAPGSADSLGTWQQWSKYDQLGHMLSGTSNTGVVTQYIYDANGNATLSFQAGMGNEDVSTATVSQYMSFAKTITEYDKKNQSIKTYQPDFTVADVLAQLQTANLSVNQSATATNPVTITVTKTAPVTQPVTPEVGQIGIFRAGADQAGQAVFQNVSWVMRLYSAEPPQINSATLNITLPATPSYDTGDFVIEVKDNANHILATSQVSGTSISAQMTVSSISSGYSISVYKLVNGQRQLRSSTGQVSLPNYKYDRDENRSPPSSTLYASLSPASTVQSQLLISAQPTTATKVQVWLRGLGSNDAWGSAGTGQAAIARSGVGTTSNWFSCDLASFNLGNVLSGNYEILFKGLDANGNAVSIGEATLQDGIVLRRAANQPAGLQTSSPSSKPGITIPNPGVTYSAGLAGNQTLIATVTATPNVTVDYRGGGNGNPGVPYYRTNTYNVNNVTVGIPASLIGWADGYVLELQNENDTMLYRAFAGGQDAKVTLPLSLDISNVKVKLFMQRGSDKIMVAQSGLILQPTQSDTQPVGGSQSYPVVMNTDNYPRSFLVRNINSDVSRLVLNYRPVGSTAGYQQATLDKDEDLTNAFLFTGASIGLQEGVTYEFQYIGLGTPAGASSPMVLARLSGTILSAGTNSYFGPTVGAAPKVGGDGFSYIDSTGLLNLVDQGRSSLTDMPTNYAVIKVRAIRKTVLANGQIQRTAADTWVTLPSSVLSTKVVKSKKVVNGQAVPGWFTFDPSSVIGAQLVSMGWGTLDTSGQWVHPYADGQDIELDYELLSYNAQLDGNGKVLKDANGKDLKTLTNDVSGRVTMPTYRLSNGGQAQFQANGLLNIVDPAVSTAPAGLNFDPASTQLRIRVPGGTWIAVSTLSLVTATPRVKRDTDGALVKDSEGNQVMDTSYVVPVRGMYTANLSGFAPGSYEIELTSKTADQQTVSVITGLIDLGNSVAATRSVLAYTPTADYQASGDLFPSQFTINGYFGNGAANPAEMKVTFTARSNGQTNSNLSWTFDVWAQGGQPAFNAPTTYIIDTSRLVPDPTQTYWYDVTFAAQSPIAGNPPITTGSAVVSLGAKAEVLTQGQLTRDPTKVTFVANETNAVSARLSYRLKSTDDAGRLTSDQDLTGVQPFTTQTLSIYNGYFTLDATKLAPNQGWRSYEYFYDLIDANGNVLSRRSDSFVLGTGGPAANTEERWTYSLTATRNLNITRSQTYDAFGEIISETDGLGNVRNLKYNVLGQLIERRDPTVNNTLADGTIVQVTPTTKYLYSLAGRLVGVQDANSNAAGDSKISYYLTNGYRDAQGQALVEKEFHTDKGWVQNDYDEFGQVRARTELIDASKVSTSLYTYNKLGQLTDLYRLRRDIAPKAIGDTSAYSQLNADPVNDPHERYVYDAAGRRIQTTDAVNNDSKTYYDFAGRVVRTINGAKIITDYQYNYLNTIQGLNGAVTGGYRKITTVGYGTADARTSTDDQDVFGHLTHRVDQGGHDFVNQYNRAGWLIKQTSTTGQNIDYSYYANGYIKSIADNTMKIETDYAYDKEGNRSFEGYRNLVPVGSQSEYYQSANISYDALNRISRVLNADQRADIRYEYDANGNVRRVNTSYKSADGVLNSTQDLWYTYDSMNRFLVSQGSMVNGVITKGTAGVTVAYDLAGHRVAADYSAGYGAAGGSAHLETYSYTSDGYLKQVNIDGTKRVENTIDAAGRTTLAVQYKDDGSSVLQSTETHYLADNRITTQKTISNGANASTTDTSYAYQTNGTLASTHAVSSGGSGTGSTVDTTYAYELWDGAKQSKVTVTGALLQNNPSGWKPGEAKYKYDVNGHLVDVEVADKVDSSIGNRRFSYRVDAQGLIMRRDEYINGNQYRWRQYYYVGGKRVGDVANDGPSRNDYADALQALNNQGNNDTRYRDWKPIASADFDQNYEPISPDYPGSSSGSYIVNTGDTLQSIAQAVWGDASMWYVLAEANGLTGQETLRAGQVLSTPNKVTNIHHTATTQRVYNPGEAMGEVNPSLPNAPTPQQDSGGGCGGIGQILMIVVAVVVSIYTAGAASALLGSQIAGAAVGAAAGSIASQAVGLATGTIDKFSWSQVGISALSAGIGSAASIALGSFAESMGLNTMSTAIVKGAGSALITQGLMSAVGLQTFSWRGVAAAAISSPAGGANNGASLNVLGAVGANVVAQLATTGKVDPMQVFQATLNVGLEQDFSQKAQASQIAADPNGVYQGLWYGTPSLIPADPNGVYRQPWYGAKAEVSSTPAAPRGMQPWLDVGSVVDPGHAYDWFGQGVSNPELTQQILDSTADQINSQQGAILRRAELVARGATGRKVPVGTGQPSLDPVQAKYAYGMKTLVGLKESSLSPEDKYNYAQNTIKKIGGDVINYYLNRAKPASPNEMRAYEDTMHNFAYVAQWAGARPPQTPYVDNSRLASYTVDNGGLHGYPMELPRDWGQFGIGTAKAGASYGLPNAQIDAFNYSQNLGVSALILDGLGNRDGAAILGQTSAALASIDWGRFSPKGYNQEDGYFAGQAGLILLNLSGSMVTMEVGATRALSSELSLVPNTISNTAATTRVTFTHTLDTLPKNWIQEPGLVSIEPTLDNANGLASKLAVWATDQGATKGAATVHIDSSGAPWLGLSKYAGNKLGMFKAVDPQISAIQEASGVGYWGSCGELQSYTGFVKTANVLPSGGFIGAAQVGERLGQPAGTVMRACPSCTYVNGQLGVGFIDSEGNLVLPR